MSEKNKVGVALTKELCPICAKTEMDGDIIMNTRLTQSAAKKVEDLHGKVVQWSKKPCHECQKLVDTGFVLIGAVEAKTTDATNPYRSGNLWVVKQEVAVSIFGPKPPASGIAFIDINVANQLGLPGVNMEA